MPAPMPVNKKPMASEHHHYALLAGKTDGAGMAREDTFQPGCRQSPDALLLISNCRLNFR